MKPFSGKKKARFVPCETVIVFRLFLSATFGLNQITVSQSTARRIVHLSFRGLLLLISETKSEPFY